MTTPSTAPDAVRPEQAQEDVRASVEILARFLGWVKPEEVEALGFQIRESD